MAEHTPTISQAELRPLLELTQRIGSAPLLTQASTGNISAKLDGELWIKTSASGWLTLCVMTSSFRWIWQRP